MSFVTKYSKYISWPSPCKTEKNTNEQTYSRSPYRWSDNAFFGNVNMLVCFQCHYNDFHMFGMVIMKVPGSWFVGETSSLPMWSNNFVGLNSLRSRWAFLSNHSLSRPLLLYTSQNSQSSKLITQDKKLSLKGQCYEIFDFRFFMNEFPPSTWVSL